MRNLTVQSENRLNICGKLVSLETGAGKTKAGQPYERATAMIRVNQTYCGVTEVSEIPVSFFATQFTSQGAVNPAFESLQTLKNCKTIQNVGIDDADTIVITRAELQENNFVSRNSGQLISGFQIRASFFNKRNAADIATFSAEIVILDMKDEVDREGEPTGRLIVKGGLVQWGQRLDVVEFIVEGEDQVDYISRNWNPNDTVKVSGRIRFTSKEVKRHAESSSWGETIESTDTRVMRELIITGGSDEGYDEDSAYDVNEIRKGFNMRKARIEQLQNEAKSPAKTASPAPKQGKNYDWE